MTNRAKTEKKKKNEDEMLKDFERRKRNKRQFIGIFAGIGLGLVLGSLIPFIRENFSLSSIVLWSGAIGGIVASFEYFEQAGAALSRSENRILNYTLGIGIPIIVLLSVSLLIR